MNPDSCICRGHLSEMEQRKFSRPPPLALYVHVPWCLRKCPYCDFNSHALSGPLDSAAYVEALLSDLELELPLVAGRELVSVFIGGGTPSLLSAEAVARLLEGVSRRLPLAPHAEVTLEANPGAVEAGRFAGFRAAGVNRLSIGVQSFSSVALQRLGRIHGPDAGREALTAARKAGFDNINIDLMFGLPGQDREAAQQDIKQALELAPEHISYYQLTLEPNTLFATRPPRLPEEELIEEMHLEGQHRLAEAGYAQYEISAYSQPGRQCRHNLNYWTFGDYLGLGAGAHGKLTTPKGGEVWRRWRVRGPDRYLRAAGSRDALAGRRVLSNHDLLLEFMMNSLRLNQGFSRDLFQERCGLPIAVAEPGITTAMGLGLLSRADGAIVPSERGLRYLNDLLGCFA